MKRKFGAAIGVFLCAFAIAFCIVSLPATRDLAANPVAVATGSSAEPAASEPESAPAEPAPAYEPSAVLVSLEPGTTPDQLAAELASDPALAGVAVVEQVSTDLVKLSLPSTLSVEDAATAIPQAAPSATAAQPNRQLYTQESTPLVAASIATVQAVVDANDPDYVEGKQWGLTSVNAPEAWGTAAELADATNPVTVAVIDAGFYVNHADLIDNVVAQYDAAADSSTITPDNPKYSEIDHGTHVAGIVAARTNNGLGIAGSSYNLCNVMPVRIQDADGYIYEDYLVRAYDYIIAHAKELNLRVISMSLGGASAVPVTTEFDALHKKINEAYAAGIVTVVAACNKNTAGEDVDGTTKYFTPPFYAYPSDFSNVISVIALANTGPAADNGVNLSTTSNYNVTGQRAKNISAPGVGIYGLYGSEDKYGTKDGTSMSTPLVAAVLGMMFRVNPDLTPERATQILYGTAYDLTLGSHMKTGWDVGSGYGEVDAASAVAHVQPKSIDISNATITLSAKSFTYNGQTRKPTVKSVSVKLGNATIPLTSADYKITNNGTRKGTGTVKVTGKGVFKGIAKATYTVSVKKTKVYQLYNKKTGQWFYTTSTTKRASKIKSGWTNKGTAWNAPSKSLAPVYYKKSSGKILYTTKKTSSGIAFYSDDYKTRPVYRYYNAKTKTYRYTTKKLTSSTYKRKSTLFYAL